MGFFVFIRRLIFRPPRKVDYWMDGILHQYFHLINTSTYFEISVITILVLDAFITCISVSNQDIDSVGYMIITCIFYGFYTLELTIRYSDESGTFWNSKMNCFDFFILILIYVQLSEGFINSVKLMHYAHQLVNLRFFRLFRISKHVEGLALVTHALMDTIVNYALNVFILLLLFMYLFGILGHHLFGIRSNNQHDLENWGSLGKTFSPLIAYTTMDSWIPFHDILEEKGFVYVARIFACAFILIVGFVVMTSLRAIVISNISRMKQAQEKKFSQEEELLLSRKHERFLRRQYHLVNEMAARQLAGDPDTFEELARDYLEQNNNHEDFVIWRDMCGDPLWIFSLLQTLDYQDTVSYRLQQYHFEMATVMLKLLEIELYDDDTRSVASLPLND